MPNDSVNDEPIFAPSSLELLTKYTEAIKFPMPSQPRTGALLRALAASKPGGRLLELGTGTGLGTAWLLSGMDAAATLMTIEIDPEISAEARASLSHDSRLTFVTTDAEQWIATYDGPPFDLIFADCEPGKFSQRQELFEHLTNGGLYVGDDLKQDSNWIEPEHPARVAEFLRGIRAESGLIVTLLDWASGIVIAVKTTAN